MPARDIKLFQKSRLPSKVEFNDLVCSFEWEAPEIIGLLLNSIAWAFDSPF